MPRKNVTRYTITNIGVEISGLLSCDMIISTILTFDL